MSGEILTAKTLEEAKVELRKIYQKESHSLSDLSMEEYKAFENDEREDSDNHLNLERLESKESEVIDLTYYKYLPDRKIAYRVTLIDKQGEKLEDYFMVIPETI
ncbi:hypothetical protein HN709_01650 [Candidatus Peregrinibacteria bacterium]|jgi:hypothetical protein|nr:hypothetical protein [Candidatus Peregrinibacteria bacterium]MBT7736367.1 hypothetical protein [Candidatus Peregrinibacteria bacterium]